MERWKDEIWQSPVFLKREDVPDFKLDKPIGFI
jgi:hypothetical protein